MLEFEAVFVVAVDECSRGLAAVEMRGFDLRRLLADLRLLPFGGAGAESGE